MLQNRSLSGNLRLLTSAVFVILIFGFLSAFTYFSTRVSTAQRIESLDAFGTTLSTMLTRAISTGDYITVEQALRGISTEDYICQIRVNSQNDQVIAKTENSRGDYCKNKKSWSHISYPVQSVETKANKNINSIGNIEIDFTRTDLTVIASQSIAIAIVFGLLLLIVVLMVNQVAIDWALGPLSKAVETVTATNTSALSVSEHQEIALRLAPREIKPLLNQIINLYQNAAKAEGDAKVVEVARQVAHDIRSPLSVLNMISTSGKMEEEERILLRKASNHIGDIANDLTVRFKELESAKTLKEGGALVGARECELIAILIDEIVSEFRLKLKSRLNLEIESNFDESNFGLCAKIDPGSFKRALSNFIQNAVDSIEGSGKIQIRSYLTGQNAMIEVIDNGKGIPKDLIPKLGESGATFGKANGSGLGLFHAKQTVALLFGTLSIESEVGQGSKVIISLPVGASPSWFVPKLTFYGTATVVILDDDPSIHQVWKERFQKLNQNSEISLIHFTSGIKFNEWVKENPKLGGEAFYFIDYELIGETDTGLTHIIELKLQKRSVLVTSRYDENYVREKASLEGVRLLPKRLANYLPIQLYAKTPFCVLIDDCDINHLAWNIVAEKSERSILTVLSEDDIRDHVFSKDTSIYVDRNLEGGVRGEDVLRRLYGEGYKNLYLYTGDTVTKEDFPELPFVRGVFQKEQFTQILEKNS